MLRLTLPIAIASWAPLRRKRLELAEGSALQMEEQTKKSLRWGLPRAGQVLVVFGGLVVENRRVYLVVFSGGIFWWVLKCFSLGLVDVNWVHVY